MVVRKVVYWSLLQGPMDAPQEELLTADVIRGLRQLGWMVSVLRDTVRTYADLSALIGRARTWEAVCLRRRLRDSADQPFEWDDVLSLEEPLGFEVVTGAGGETLYEIVIMAVSPSQGARIAGPSPEYVTREGKVSFLVRQYGEELKEAALGRSKHRNLREGALWLDRNGYLTLDLGQYLPFLGREETFQAFLGAGAEVFNTFLAGRPVEDNTWPRCEPDAFYRLTFLVALVAFPGAGKTTFGQQGRYILAERWTSPDDMHQATKEKILTEKLKPERKDAFMQMIDNTLTSPYNLAVNHTLLCESGGILPAKEKNLSCANILALRWLFASLLKDDALPAYQEFLKNLWRLAPDFMRNICLEDFFEAFRLALDIPPNKVIMLNLFLDELNGPRGMIKTVSGKAKEEELTWGQQLMSEYVHNMYKLAGGSTFPVLTVATTKYSSASLKFTVTGKGKAYFIPLRTLSRELAEEAVLHFQNRLAAYLNEVPCQVLTNAMRTVLSWTGGMPRAIGLALRALLSNSMGAPLSPRALLNEMVSTDVTWLRMDRTFQNLKELVARTTERKAYSMDVAGFPVLLRVLQASIMGEHVERANPVIESVHAVNWGDLEAEGVIGLNPVHTFLEPIQKKRRTGVVGAATPCVNMGVELNKVPAKVTFCPVLMDAYLSNSRFKDVYFASRMPYWRMKEATDVMLVVLKLCIIQQLQPVEWFKLADVLPESLFMGKILLERKFKLPHFSEFHMPKKVGQLKTRKVFLRQMKASKKDWIFIGPGNFGADSWLKLTDTEGQAFFLVFESKLVTGKERTVGIENIFYSLRKSCGRWFSEDPEDPDYQPSDVEVETAEEEDGEETMEESADEEDVPAEVSWAADNFLFVYVTDETVQQEDLRRQQDMTDSDKLLIVARDWDSNKTAEDFGSILELRYFKLFGEVS